MRKLLLLVPILLNAQTNSIQLCDQQSVSHCITAKAPSIVTSDISLNFPNNAWIDSSGFFAFGHATINDSTAIGYVVGKVDEYFGDQDNEVRGISSNVSFYRTTPDEATMGWDQFALSGVVIAWTGMDGGNYIRGQQKAVNSELYYQTPITPYTANIGMNYMASLSQVASGITLNNWAGLIVATPGVWGSGGTVVNGSGIWIQDLSTNGILTSATTAAIKIDGLGNFGRIQWVDGSLYTITGGLGTTNSLVINTSMTNEAGLYFQMPATNPGGLTGITGIIQYAAGTPAVINIGNVYNITASGDIVTAYTHHLDAGSIMSNGNTVINTTGSIIVNTTLTDTAGLYMLFPATNAGGYTGLTGIIQYAAGSPAVANLAHIYNLTIDGDFVSSYTHHVDSGSYLASGQTIINTTGSFIANTTITDTAGYYMMMPSSNPGGYTGLTGVIQYAAGSPAVINIGHLHDVTATGTISTVNLNISGTCSGCSSGSGMIYPSAGVPYSTGSAWGSSYTVGTAANNLVQLDSNAQIVTIDSIKIASNGTTASGLYMNNTGIIQWDSSYGTISIGNIYNLAASGDITTTGTHHIGSGTGGYYVGVTQIVDGSRNASVVNLTISGTCTGCPSSSMIYPGAGIVNSTGSAWGTSYTAGTGANNLVQLDSSARLSLTDSITANSVGTNLAGFYVHGTGVIQYDSGSSTISISNIYNLTAAGDIVTVSGHHVDAGTYYFSGTKYLQLSSTNLQILSGLLVQNISGTYMGINAGSYAIAGTTVIDGSGNYSSTGYLNGSSLLIGGNATINNSRQWVGSAIGDSYISSASVWNSKVVAVYGNGGISSSGGTSPTISCTYCVLLGGSQINSSGVFIGAGVSTPSYGVNAGSFAIAGTTIIDGSRNVSTTGYLNGASLYIGSVLTINSSRQWIGDVIGDSYISSASTWNGKVSSVGGSGGISSSGGTAPTISCSNCILLGGSQINSSGAFVGAGVNVGSYGVNSGGYSINGGYYGVTSTTCSQFRGGICTAP